MSKKYGWDCPRCGSTQHLEWSEGDTVECYHCGSEFEVYGIEETLKVDGWSYIRPDSMGSGEEDEK